MRIILRQKKPKTLILGQCRQRGVSERGREGEGRKRGRGECEGWGIANILRWARNTQVAVLSRWLWGTAAHFAFSGRDSRCFTDPATANLGYDS